MIQQQLYEWITHPERLNRDTLYELRKLLARYPYFQTVRLLYLKNLFLLHDMTFGEELRKAALYVADRKVLFYLIEGERFTVSSFEKQDGPKEEGGLDRTLSLIDTFLSSLPEEPVAMELPMDVTTDYTPFLLHEEECVSEDVPRMKGQNLIDNFIEKSAEEPLLPQLGRKEGVPVKKELPEEVDFEDKEEELGNREKDSGYKGEVPGDKEVELGNREKDSGYKGEEPGDKEVELGNGEKDSGYKGEEPGEKEMDFGNNEENSENKEEEPEEESYFTETLAKIYVKQQRYSKALEIIKKLNLKYPKKNAYFADQIRFLEKLIINTKPK